MDDTRKLIGSRIKALRRQAGKTQEVLADEISMDARHLSRLEVGRHYPSIESLERLAKVLNVPLSEFFTFADQESIASSKAYLRRFIAEATPRQVQTATSIVRALMA